LRVKGYELMISSTKSHEVKHEVARRKT